MKFRSCLVFEVSTSAFLLVGSLALAQTPSTERVSVATPGTQGNAAGSPYATPSISADGRYVAFDSAASNLVVGDTNGFVDIFVRDRTNGTTERVSVATGGAQSNALSGGPSISADGRFVAFHSYATNIVAGTTGSDVFVRDRQLSTTERVSMSTAGAPGNSFSFGGSISADGRFVAFTSHATNLVVGPFTGAPPQIYVRDRQNGTTAYVSLDWISIGTVGDQGSNLPVISADGRYVGFVSQAHNIVPSDVNGHTDVFVRDLQTGTNSLVSVDSAGAQANDDSRFLSVSNDGRFVAFESLATNLVAGDTNAARDIFVRDRQTGTTSLVSADSMGTRGNGDSVQPSISADGGLISFQSLASNLVSGDTNGVGDIFVRYRVAGWTERVSVRTGGVEGNQASLSDSISADGQFVAFASDAWNLVAGDTNGFRDTFVHHRGPPSPIVYCTAGTTSNGCSASVAASACPSASFANACNLTVTGADGQKSCLLFYGLNNSGYSPGPWALGSTSWLCVKHPTQRTPIQNSGGTFGVCNGSIALDWNAFQAAHPLALGNPWTVGSRIYAQAWFRDPLAVKTTNLSDALVMICVP